MSKPLIDSPLDRLRLTFTENSSFTWYGVLGAPQHVTVGEMYTVEIVCEVLWARVERPADNTDVTSKAETSR